MCSLKMKVINEWRILKPTDDKLINQTSYKYVRSIIYLLPLINARHQWGHWLHNLFAHTSYTVHWHIPNFIYHLWNFYGTFMLELGQDLCARLKQTIYIDKKILIWCHKMNLFIEMLSCIILKLYLTDNFAV